MDIAQDVIEMIDAGDFDSEQLATLHRAVLKARNLPYAGMGQKAATDFILEQIHTGRQDENLPGIYNAVRARQAIVRGQERVPETFNVGDTIRVIGKLKPNYLFGHTFIVTKINPKTVAVNIPSDPKYRRFSGARDVKIPKNAVEVVEAT